MDIGSYDAHHRHPLNRAAHIAGIPLIVVAGVLSLLPARSRRRIPRSAALACFGGGWLLLWLGHMVEGNRPLLFSDPSAVWGALRWWAAQPLSGSSGASPRRALSESPSPAPAPDVGR